MKLFAKDTLVTLISDLDGTLVNTAASVFEWLWLRFQVPFNEFDLTTYHWDEAVTSKISSVSPSELNKELHQCCWDNPEFYVNLKPYWTLWTALQLAGERVSFITARPEPSQDVTYRWLKWWSGTVEWMDVKFAKTSYERCSAVKSYVYGAGDGMLPVVYIDDKPDSVLAVAEMSLHETLPIKSILVARSWNVAWVNSNLDKLTDYFMVMSESEIAEQITQCLA